jgi:hypothetical protein
MDHYILRGYVTTTAAIDRLFAARHPDLAANAGDRDDETRRLLSRKNAVTRREPISPIRGPARSTVRKRPKAVFTQEDAERLWELSLADERERSMREEAAKDLRSALAEGDLDAVALTDHGDNKSVRPSHWLGKDGLDTVWTARMNVQVEATDTQFVESTVQIEEVRLTAWIASVLRNDSDNPELQKSAAEPALVDRIRFFARLGIRGTDTIADSSKSTGSSQAAILPWLPAERTSEAFRVVKNTPGGGGAVTARVINEMHRQVRAGEITLAEFASLSQPKLAMRFSASRQVVIPARKTVLGQLEAEADALLGQAAEKTNRSRRKVEKSK